MHKYAIKRVTSCAGAWALALVAAQASAEAPPMLINLGAGGGWYEPATNGQGFALDVVPESNQLVAYWFTYPETAGGREWYVALYDIGDLTREPAYFPAPIGHPVWATQAALDRQALREYSYIFRGTAADLAAGLPLLRYFGGVCDVDLRPRHSRAEQERIVKLIRAFTEQPAGGATVMPLEP